MFFGRALVFALPIQCFGGGGLDKRKAVFAVIALFLLVLVLSQTGLLPFASIISAGQISFDQIGQVWVAAVAVNTTGEQLVFSKANMVEKQTDGSEIRAQSDIAVSFRQLQPYCTYSLAHKVYPLKLIFGLGQIGSVPYMELQNPVRSAPYKVAVFKNGTQVDSKDVDASALGQTTYLLASGDVKLNNLGQLSQGINCPDASGALLIPVYGSNNQIVEYRLVDRASWFDMMMQVINFLNQIPPNISAVSTLLSMPPVSQPSSFYNTSPSLGVISETSRDLIVNLPKSSVIPVVTIEVSARLADTFTYVPPNPVPQIIALSLDRSTIVQSETATLVVTVKNVGTSDGSFNLLPYNSKGFISFAPVSDRIDIARGATGTKNFKVYGFVSGSDAACVKVVGIQSGEEVTQCVNITIQDNPNVPEPVPAPIPEPQPEPVPIVPCGNGVCEFGEAITCPQDCYNPPSGISLEEECLSRQGDGIFVLRYTWIEPQALGLIAGRCDTVFNWPLVILAVVGIAGAIGVVYIWKKK